jgi:hypothetical protein
LEKALKGKAVYIVGADPVGDDPNFGEGFESAKFVAVQDVLETATTEIADVVFPAQAFTEREGTFISGERRVQRFYPRCRSKGDSKPDYAITSQLPSKWVSSSKAHRLRWSSIFLPIRLMVGGFELRKTCRGMVNGRSLGEAICITAAQPMRIRKAWAYNCPDGSGWGNGTHLKGQERGGSSSQRKRIAGGSCHQVV